MPTNNRSVYDSQELDNQEQINAGTWVEYDVTRAVQGEGTYTFVIAADSGDAVSFLSRESDQAPELVVTYLPGVQPEPTAASSAGEVILVGAGDISMCSNDYDELTARLLDNIPGTVFTTGDKAYPSGRVEDFTDCYDPTWGRHKDRTYPIPGNHDYRTDEGSPYYQYFGNIPDGGEAEMLIPVDEITPNGSTLTTSDTPLAVAYNTTTAITLVPCTVVEE